MILNQYEEDGSSCYFINAQSTTADIRIEPSHLGVSGVLGSISMIVRASSTQTTNLVIFDLNAPFDSYSTSTTVTSVKGIKRWNFLGSGFRIAATSSYRLAFSGDPPVQFYGTTATRTDVLSYATGGNSWVGALSPCTSDFGMPYLETDTNGVNTAGVPSIDLSNAPVNCTGIFDVGCQFTRAIAWAFTPSSDSWDQFITLKDDLKEKAPFGYFTGAIAAIGGIEGSSTPSFSIATSSPLMNYIFSPLRTGLLWLIYFAALLWIYKRVTKINA